jgi:hypothetical protein
MADSGGGDGDGVGVWSDGVGVEDGACGVGVAFSVFRAGSSKRASPNGTHRNASGTDEQQQRAHANQRDGDHSAATSAHRTPTKKAFSTSKSPRMEWRAERARIRDALNHSLV